MKVPPMASLQRDARGRGVADDGDELVAAVEALSLLGSGRSAVSGAEVPSLLANRV